MRTTWRVAGVGHMPPVKTAFGYFLPSKAFTIADLRIPELKSRKIPNQAMAVVVSSVGRVDEVQVSRLSSGETDDVIL